MQQNKNRRKIAALWSTPRSRSTAFMWMIRLRGDFTVLQEPFGRSAYYSEERIFNRADDIEPEAKYNYTNVLRSLQQQAEETPLFIKDFPYYFMHTVNKEFLDSFQHTFLIRDPAQMLPSYYHKMPDVTFRECGYQELAQLFDQVCDHTGEVPPVINANDLVQDPGGIIQAYCAKLDIPFMPDALDWKPPGNSDEIGWWGDRSWNDDLRVSNGFQDTQKSYLTVHENDELRTLYELCLPFYAKLNQHCLDMEPATDARKV